MKSLFYLCLNKQLIFNSSLRFYFSSSSVLYTKAAYFKTKAAQFYQCTSLLYSKCTSLFMNIPHFVQFNVFFVVSAHVYKTKFRYKKPVPSYLESSLALTFNKKCFSALYLVIALTKTLSF